MTPLRRGVTTFLAIRSGQFFAIVASAIPIAKIEVQFSAQARSIKIAEPGRQGWAIDRLVAPATHLQASAPPGLGLLGNFCARRTPDPEPISALARRKPRGATLRSVYASLSVRKLLNLHGSGASPLNRSPLAFRRSSTLTNRSLLSAWAWVPQA